MEFLTWLENLSFVTWVRESSSLLGYTLFLAGHTIGLVFLVGPNLLIAARVLGLAPDLPLRPLAKFRPVMTVGLWLTFVTGVVLFATDPVHYVKNIVFIVKIAAIIAAVVCLNLTLSGLFSDDDEQPVSVRAKALTTATLVFWAIAVVAGRLTAYSGVVVVASITAFLIVVANAAWIMTLSPLVRRRRTLARRDTFASELHPTPANGGK